MADKNCIRSISSPSRFIIIGIIILLFFMICLNYASKISLWGDEASSLSRAESSIKSILFVDSGHTPTYFLLLKSLIALGLHQELALRAVHIIPFVIGLLIGYKTLVTIFSDRKDALITLGIATILPNYIFYATNLRMYSLLFMFSMAFIGIIAITLNIRNNLTNFQLTILGLVSLGLLFSDYSGIIYYLPGLICLLFYSFYTRSYKSLFVASGAGLLFLITMFFFSELGKNIRSIQNWPVAASQSIGNVNRNFMEIGKLIYLSLRPGLDLIYGAGINPILAIGLSILLLSLYIYGLILILRKEPRKPAILWLLAISAIWLAAAPTGYSFTRIFLPSHFFIIAVIVRSLNFLNKPSRLIYWFILGTLIALCLKEAVSPTLRLYNLIPYQQIAEDTLEIAQQQKSKTILLSGNSLNTLSIERYINQKIRDGEKDKIKIVRIEDDNLELTEEHKTYPLIFISHMKEGDKFIDVKPLATQLNKEFEEIKVYVDLQNLPYNSLWKKRITDRANQHYAIEIYLLR